MKKFFLLVIMSVFISETGLAQDDTNKKFRAGLKGTLAPSWFTSGDNNTTKLNTGFNSGFGLLLDFRLSDVIYFSTGIGGDFESGSVKYRNDGFPATLNAYAIKYMLDNSGTLVEAKNDVDPSTYSKDGYTSYVLQSRSIKNSFVTIPIALKMMTKEYSGFRYFGTFGGDIGIRVSSKADDTYSYKVANTGTTTVATTGTGVNTNVNFGKDASLIPLRVGLNVGLGAEYRIAGSTSLFLSVNYFRSFTNLMTTDSKYLYTGSTIDTNGKIVFTHLQQNLIMSAIKINLGIMF